MYGVTTQSFNLQISSKMYVFDSTSHSWKERGRGELHLNDSHQSTSPIPQSRIGMIYFVIVIWLD